MRADEEATVAKNRGYLLSGGRDYLVRAEESRSAFLRDLKQLDKNTADNAEGILLEKIRETDDAYQKIFSRFISLKGFDRDFEQNAREFEVELEPKHLMLEDAVDRYVTLTGQNFRNETTALSETNRKVFFLLVMVSLMGLALVIVLSVLVTRMLSRLYGQAEKLAMARKEIVETVAHDLRNPIAAIKLNIDLLLRAASDDESLTVRAVAAKVERIRRSTIRMNRLVGSYLDLTKANHGVISLEKGCVRVYDLLNDVIESFEPLCFKKAISLKIEKSVSCEVHCDYERVMQVFSNLVGNAVKFSRTGSQIKIGLVKKGTMAIFYVSDCGPGIPSHEQPHLFDRYWQSESQKNTGTGLGLAICRGIVEGHGGEIWVESEFGAGATFRFSIPLNEGPSVKINWKITGSKLADQSPER